MTYVLSHISTKIQWRQNKPEILVEEKNVIHSANSPYRSGKTCLKVAESELGWTNSQGLALVLGLETGARRENAGSPNNSSQFIVVREETVLHAQVRDTVVPGLFPSNILYPFLHWYLAYFFSSLPRPTICFFFQVFLLSASTHHYHMPFFSSHKSFQNKKRN